MAGTLSMRSIIIRIIIIVLFALVTLAVVDLVSGSGENPHEARADSLEAVLDTMIPAMLERDSLAAIQQDSLIGVMTTAETRMANAEASASLLVSELEAVLSLAPDTVRVLVRATIDTLEIVINECQKGLQACQATLEVDSTRRWDMMRSWLATQSALNNANLSLDYYRAQSRWTIPRFLRRTVGPTLLGGAAGYLACQLQN